MKVETYTHNKEQDVKIGERLKAIRTANELSHEEFASRICCHPFDYTRVENGTETYRGSILKLISYEFGVSLSWIMQGVPAETDPEFCKLDTDGQRIFNSCITVQEAIWDYATDNGMDMWSSGVERGIERIHSSIRYELKQNYIPELEKYIDDYLRDAVALANYDGYTAGWRTAIQLVKGLFNLNDLPDEPPVAPKSDRVISPEIVTAARSAKPRETAKVAIHKANGNT